MAGVRCDRTRRKLLSTVPLTYARAREILIQEETVQAQSRVLAQSMPVNSVRTQQRGNQGRRQQQQQNRPGAPSTQPQRNNANPNLNRPNQNGSCYRCGRRHDPRTCGVIGWECRKCTRKGTSPRSANRPESMLSTPNPSNSDPNNSTNNSSNNDLSHSKSLSRERSIGCWTACSLHPRNVVL